MFKGLRLFAMSIAILALLTNMTLTQQTVYASEMLSQLETTDIAGSDDVQTDIDEEQTGNEDLDESSTVEESTDNEDLDESSTVEESTDNEDLDESRTVEEQTDDEDLDESGTIDESSDLENSDNTDETQKPTDSDDSDKFEVTDELTENEIECNDKVASEEKVLISLLSNIEELATIQLLSDSYVGIGDQELKFTITLTQESGLIFVLERLIDQGLVLSGSNIGFGWSNSDASYALSTDGRILTVTYNQIHIGAISHFSKLIVIIPNSCIKYGSGEDSPTGFEFDVTLKPRDPSLQNFSSIRAGERAVVSLDISSGTSYDFDVSNLTAGMFHVSIEGSKADVVTVYPETARIKSSSPDFVGFEIEMLASAPIDYTDGCAIQLIISKDAVVGAEEDIVVNSTFGFAVPGRLSETPVMADKDVTVETNSNVYAKIPVTLPEGYTYKHDTFHGGRSRVENINCYCSSNSVSISSDKKTLEFDLGISTYINSGEGFYIFEIESFDLLYNSHDSEYGLVLKIPINIVDSSHPSIESFSSIKVGAEQSLFIRIIPGKGNSFNVNNVSKDKFTISVSGKKSNSVSINNQSIVIHEILEDSITLTVNALATEIIEYNDYCLLNILIGSGVVAGVEKAVTLTSSNSLIVAGKVQLNPVISDTNITIEQNTSKTVKATVTLPKGFTYGSENFRGGTSWYEGVEAYSFADYKNIFVSTDQKVLTFDINIKSFNSIGDGYYIYEVNSFDLLYEGRVSTESLQFRFPITIRNSNTGGADETLTNNTETDNTSTDNIATTPVIDTDKDIDTTTTPKASESKDTVPIVVEGAIEKAKIKQDKETGTYEITFNHADTKELIEELKSSDTTSIQIDLLPSNETTQNSQPKYDILLPIKALTEASDLKTITIGTGKATLDLPIQSLKATKNSDNIKITIEEPKNLPSLYAKAISGGRPALTFDVTVGDKPIDINENPASLSIKYNYTHKDIAMSLKIGVIFIDVNGNMSVVESTYNQETGFFDFAATKVGTYFIGNIGSIK